MSSARSHIIVMNVYALKMAGVFMFSTSTVIIYTGIAPRWIAILGYALALLLIFGSSYVGWSVVVFPIWVFLLSSLYFDLSICAARRRTRLEQWRRTAISAFETLRDGWRVEIRALRPDDRQALAATVGRTSAQSLYRRFFAVRRSFSETGNRLLRKR